MMMAGVMQPQKRHATVAVALALAGVVALSSSRGAPASEGNAFTVLPSLAAPPAAATPTSANISPSAMGSYTVAANTSVVPVVGAAALVLALALAGARSRPAASRSPLRVTVAMRAAAEAAAAEEDDEDDSDDEEYMDEEEEDIAALGFSEDDDDEYYDDDEQGAILEAKCKAKYLRGSAQKFRRVLWQIRGRSYRDALMMLEFMPWRACKPVLKALQSAAANGQNHFNMDKSRLYVSRCFAMKGPPMKRMRPASKGGASMYDKHMSHLTIYVAEREEELA